MSCAFADEKQPQIVKAFEPTASEGIAATDDLRTTVELATARDRAKLMHKIYLSTSDVMHERYFHVNRGVLPARAVAPARNMSAATARARPCTQ